MKKLAEQRKGDEDNVISFEQPVLATAPRGPVVDDWLRKLSNGCRFLCREKATPKSVFLKWYGIADVQDLGVMLGTDHDFNPGHVKFIWVDSQNFSAQHTFVQLLPDMKTQEEQPPEEQPTQIGEGVTDG